jgi:hypothetical protein
MSDDRGAARPARTVPAQWALVSKRLDPSGTYAIEGYEVVGTSGPMALAQSIQNACLTGTPSSTATGTADALPWVIVTGGAGLGPVMAMSVVTSSALRTEGGRAVTPARLLWTDWADAASGRMSWTAMARGHQTVDWSDTIMPAQSPAGAVPLPVADFRPAAVAEDIDRFGYDWVAGLAGLVLDGRRIAVVAEAVPLPGPDERLKLFDAVCALLPYGYRARFSAATWARANVEHHVLMVFADAVAKDQHRVVWQAPLPRPHSSDAAYYVEALLRLRHGDAKFRTLDIVEHLLGEPDPSRYPDAAACRDRLLRMDLPREVARLIAAGRARVSDVRRVLAEHPLDGLPSTIAQTMVQFLADKVGPDPAARNLLVQTWSAETERRLGAYGRSFLTTSGRPRLDEWFDVAEHAGPTAKLNLLRELLRPTSPLPPASADEAVRLLSDFRGAINDAAVQELVAEQPAVCVALLRHILERGIATQRAVEQIEQWLADPSAGSRPWLAPFGFAIGRGEPTDEQWRALSHTDDRVWTVLLRIGTFCRQSPRVFASMWPHLVERAGRRTTPAADAAFDGELRALNPAHYHLGEHEWPRIDVVHLIRFGAMPGLAALPSDRYGAAFQTAWYDPVLAGRRAVLGSPLVNQVFPKGGRPEQAVRLMAVVPPTDPDLLRLAATAIAQEIDARPADFGSVPFPQNWINAIRRHSRRESFWIYQNLRTLAETNSGMQRVAEGYMRGRRAELSRKDLDQLLGPWIRLQHPGLIMDFLLELWRHHHGDDAEALRRRIAARDFGKPAAENWKAFIESRYVFARWLAGETKPPRPLRQPDPPADANGVTLGAVRKRLGSLLPGSRNTGGEEHPSADTPS